MNSEIIAVLGTEMMDFGCPYCGYLPSPTKTVGEGFVVLKCEECGKLSVALVETVEVSPVEVEGQYPVRQSHPRRGVTVHGNPDNPPEGGGEWFHVHGTYPNESMMCCCCDAASTTSLEGFVECKASGERICNMFDARGGSAILDYREQEPHNVLVKIGACGEHQSCLQRLDELTAVEGLITDTMIEKIVDRRYQ